MRDEGDSAAGWSIGGLVYLHTAAVQSPFFGQWAAANCAALPTADAGQYATLICKPLLFWFLGKRRYINVQTFNF